MFLSRLIAPTLCVGLACAVGGANGFLLPPPVTPTDNDIIQSIPFEDAAQVNEQTMNLKCLECPVAAIDASGTPVWLQGVDSDLKLTFNVVNDDNDVLTLNGVQIYPPHDLSGTQLTAPQISSGTEIDLALGYELNVRPIARAENDQIEVISIDFQVVEIANKFVNGLENVQIKLIRLPSGKLLMGPLEVGPTKNPIINPSENGEECTTLICKWRAVVASKMAHFKSKAGCGSKQHGKHAGHRSHRHHGHHRHHRHSRIARFFHALKTVAVHVLLPVFIGIAVGTTASLVGMVVGNFIVFLWRKSYRRGQRGSYQRLQQAESTLIAVTLDEKSKVEFEEAPPIYEVAINEKSEL